MGSSMNPVELLVEGNGGESIDALARSFGVSREDAAAVVASVVPQIAQRIERITLSRGGVADVVAMLGGAGGGKLAAIGSDEGRSQGNALLEQIFGNRDGSRAVAARASLGSGIGASIIQAMLPYIVSMVVKSLAGRMSGGLGDIVSKIPNLGGGGAVPPSGGRMDLPMPFPSGGGGSAGGGGRSPFPFPSGSGSPLPGPDGMPTPGRNTYGDLSDVIRRGGANANAGGSPLWRMVRNVLGGALGFQSRGVAGWIVRVVVLRYGWSMLRTVLRRAFMGR